MHYNVNMKSIIFLAFLIVSYIASAVIIIDDPYRDIDYSQPNTYFIDQQPDDYRTGCDCHWYYD